jgi:hypothetical protein
MMIQADGIRALLPRDQMTESARRLRDFHAMKPDAPLVQQEFGFFTFDRWKSEGHMPEFSNSAEERSWLAQQFGFEEDGHFSLGGLGWCEAAFAPEFETKILEDRGDHELVQDYAGRSVLFFKGRRSGFMPEYLDHPVKDQATWERDVAWRLDPQHPSRYDQSFAENMARAEQAARQGKVMVQSLIGGYMYLRSLIGPLDLLYMFYDHPELIHSCMRAWFDLADAVTSRHQEHVSFDEVYMAEDICYNHGSLISPDMMREFLFPYYQQLLGNIRRRQIDQQRTMHIQIDTDGYANPLIEVYREIGMDYMSPFEVASGSDVVATGNEYPWLRMRGGIDKRVLAAGPAEIDKELDRILPAMRRRGGYIPVCDHGVPEEVSFTNYMHYRKRMLEFSR